MRRTSSAEREGTYSLLTSAINHPDVVNELWGIFNARSLDALADAGVAVDAVVPRPYAPPIGPFSRFSKIPRRDDSFSYPVAHPRFVYYLPKSLLYHRTGDSIARSLRKYLGGAPDHDVVHGGHLYPDGYALSEVVDDDVPLTASTWGTIVNEFDSLNGGTRKRIRSALERIDRVFCVSRAVERNLQRIDPDVETLVVPHGADPARFPVDDRDALRREFGVPADATLVLYVGHFTEKKGVHDLLAVLPALADTDLFVSFVGHGGDLRAEVEAAVDDDATPPGAVHWELDPVDVRRWFAAADALVLPSYTEGRPTVIYEAMASATPVLATDVGGIPEQVADGETGWLLDPGDRDALREHLRALDEEPLVPVGAAGRRRLEDQGWTWSAHADRIVNAHQALLAERRTDATTTDPGRQPPDAVSDDVARDGA